MNKKKRHSARASKAKSPRRPSKERAKRRGGKASEHQASKVVGALATNANPQAKRPGGQPGNHNALKHGFYSVLFKAKERKLLEQLPAGDLSAEIELIRVTSARFLQALEASKGTLDYEANLTALRAVNLSAQSIAALLRVQVLAGSLGRDAAEALEALDELAAEAQSPDAPPADDWGLVPSDPPAPQPPLRTARAEPGGASKRRRLRSSSIRANERAAGNKTPPFDAVQ